MKPHFDYRIGLKILAMKISKLSAVDFFMNYELLFKKLLEPLTAY